MLVAHQVENSVISINGYGYSPPPLKKSKNRKDFLHLGCRFGHTGVYICQDSSDYTITTLHFTEYIFMSIKLN